MFTLRFLSRSEMEIYLRRYVRPSFLPPKPAGGPNTRRLLRYAARAGGDPREATNFV